MKGTEYCSGDIPDGLLKILHPKPIEFLSPMTGEQLFDISNPLEERIGQHFFNELPKKPGIYKMYGRNGNLLYVGKAKNLRTRLFTYKRTKTVNTSGKIKRLVRLIHGIVIEQLSNEQQALLRENELIRKYKPPFNRAKKAPETYYFIFAIPDNGQVRFSLRMHLREEESEYAFGAFKGHRLVRSGMGAMLRQLFITSKCIDCPFLLPSQLLRKLTPMHFRTAISGEWVEYIHAYLSGASDELLYQIIHYTHQQKLLSKFIGKLILKDMETLRLFYDSCSHRNHKIVEQLQLDSHLIPQNKLDDYLVELAFS